MKAPEKNYVIIQRGTNAPELRWTQDETPEGFAGFLYDVPKLYLQDGDVVSICGHAKFAKEREWRLPSIELEGIDIPAGHPFSVDQRSVIRTSCCIDAKEGKTSPGTPSIVLGRTNVFRNLTLVGKCADPNEDAAITGHVDLGDKVVVFENCNVLAGTNQDWGLYYRWTGNKDNNTQLLLSKVTGTFSRFFISFAASASPRTTISAIQTKLTGNADGSWTNGGTNLIKDDSAVCPFLVKSGSVYLEDVETRIHGGERPVKDEFGPKRVVGLVTNAYSSRTDVATVVTGKNVHIRSLTQGAALEKADFDLRYGSPLPQIDNDVQIAIARGGSNPDGSFNVRSA